jgi:hypothetical protein
MKYLVEFAGVIVILYAKFLTHANPYIMGLVYFAVFKIAEGITTGYFTPISAVAGYMLGRCGWEDMWYNIGAQVCALVAFVISFKPMAHYIE